MPIEPPSYEKWDRAKTLMLESLHKPDDKLRGCAHNQQCYYELLEIRDQVIEMVQKMSNPRPFIDERPKIPGRDISDQTPGLYPEAVAPRETEAYVESKSYEYAADVTLSDIRRFQRGTSL